MFECRVSNLEGIYRTEEYYRRTRWKSHKKRIAANASGLRTKDDL
jgi:hypothetical protein